jgi:tetratricopeptide (TPR) repeat protein
VRVLVIAVLVSAGALAAMPDAPVVATLTRSVPVPKNETIEKAAKQVDEGDFEDAVHTVEKGIDAADLTDDQLAELYRLLGLAHLYLGNEDRARDAFEKLLQARPDYDLPKSTPPKIRSIYARIKEDIRKRRVRPVTLTPYTVGDVEGGAPVEVTARIEDMALGAKARLFYRRAGAQNFSSTDFVREKGSKTDFTAVVPAFEVPAEEAIYDVEYYLEVADAAQRRLAGRGDPYTPLSFRVLAKKTVDEQPVVRAKPWYQNPWVWVGIGVGAAALGTGAVVLATQPQTATLPIKIQIDGMP